MAGLSIKISADSQSAVSGFKSAADAADGFVSSLVTVNQKLAADSISRFIDKQKLAADALSFTRGETASLDASISAYQRKIEALIKQGLEPESEQVKSLVTEMDALKARKEAASAAAFEQAQKEAELAESFKRAAEEAAREADIITRSLDAKDELEKANIRLASEQDKVRASIKSLISSGYSPESAEVKELEGRYKELTNEINANNSARGIAEGAAKTAKAGLIGIAAATAAAIGYSVKQAAAVEDMEANYTTLLGSQKKAAELVKRINTEAATTPFEINNISGSMNKLLPLFKGNSDAAVETFRMIGDTAQGNGQKLDTLTDVYAKVQMKGKASMEDLNRINNAGVPIFDTLSKQMGVTTEELFKMSSEGKITGENLTAAFQTMTSEGGTFFKGMENASGTFNMQLIGIKESFNILAGTIGAKFLPVAKEIAGAIGDAVAGFTAWVNEGNNLENMLEIVGTALVSAAAGLTAFLIVTQGHAIITACAKAMGGLKTAITGVGAAIKANPIGLIATALAALAPIIIYVVKNWDTLLTYIEQFGARVAYIAKETGAWLKEAFITAINAIRSGFWSLVDFIQSIYMGVVSKLLGALEKIPGIGNAFKGASQAVAAFSDGISNVAQKHKEEAAAAIAAAKTEREAASAGYKERLKQIDAEAQKKREAIEAAKSESKKALDAETAETEIAMTAEAEAVEKAADITIEAGNAAAENEIERKKKEYDAFIKAEAAKLDFAKRMYTAQQEAGEKSFEQRMADLENFHEMEKASLAAQAEAAAGLEGGEDDRVAEEERINLEMLESDKRYAEGRIAIEQEIAKARQEGVSLATRLGITQKEEEARQQEEMLSTFQKYLSDKLNAQILAGENDNILSLEQGEQQKQLLEQQRAELMEFMILNDAEQIALEQALSDEIKRIDQETADSKKALEESKQNAMKEGYEGIKKLISAGAKDNRAAAIVERSIAGAEAAINTAVAATKALNAYPPPFNVIAMAGTIAAGVAQQMTIHATPIPSAETGGRFIAPDSFTGVDSGLLRVNQGEQVDVTPRGGQAEPGRIIINIDGRTFIDFINSNLRSGGVYETSPAWNMGA
jgi:tape measure domain-containing protein